MSEANGHEETEKRTESSSAVKRRHKGELKAFKQRTDRMRSSVPKKDKVKRAKLNAEIEQLTSELEQRHVKELEDAKNAEKSAASETTALSEEIGRMSMKETRADIPSLYGSGEERTESKAARRRRKKAEKEAESRRRIEEEKANLGPSQREIELKKLNEQLAPSNLTIHSIKPDGHCMYSAVGHQLTTRGIEIEIEPSVQGLRGLTATHMERYKDDFIPFLEEVGGDNDAYRKYCESIRQTAAWGGQLELRALSEALRVVIDVYSATMPLVTMGNPKSKQPHISLSYHQSFYGLGEHYNSVVPIERDSET